MATKKTNAKAKKTEHGNAAAPKKKLRVALSALDGGGDGGGGLKTEHGAKGPKPAKKR